MLFAIGQHCLKDRVGMIDDKMQDCIVMNGVS